MGFKVIKRVRKKKISIFFNNTRNTVKNELASEKYFKEIREILEFLIQRSIRSMTDDPHVTI